MVIILRESILFKSYSPCTTSVKFCSLNPMGLLATHTYAPESFTIRFPSVYCSVWIRELPDMVLRTTSLSSSLLLISTNVTGGTASTVHSRSRLAVISLLTTPDRNWRTGVTEQWKRGKWYKTAPPQLLMYFVITTFGAWMTTYREQWHLQWHWPHQQCPC